MTDDDRDAPYRSAPPSTSIVRVLEIRPEPTRARSDAIAIGWVLTVSGALITSACVVAAFSMISALAGVPVFAAVTAVGVVLRKRPRPSPIARLTLTHDALDIEWPRLGGPPATQRVMRDQLRAVDVIDAEDHVGDRIYQLVVRTTDGDLVCKTVERTLWTTVESNRRALVHDRTQLAAFLEVDERDGQADGAEKRS